MSNFKAEKRLVRDYYEALDGSDPDSIGAILDRFVTRDYLWRGCYPFNQQAGPQAVAEQFWKPLRTSLKRFQRRMDIFMAGSNRIDDFNPVWVTSTE
jgi:hypothetical protein